MTGRAIEARDLLSQVRTLLRYHQQMGISVYPLSREIKRFFALSEPERAAGTGDGAAAVRQGECRPSCSGSDREVRPGFRHLPGEIASCTRCRMAAIRRGTVAGRGGPGSGLMVVGDWSLQQEEFAPDVLFGTAEDRMLERMMGAIDLAPADVYVTNCVKCCPGADKLPDGECGNRCFSFLAREIAAVKPRVICAMGGMAARILTGANAPLSRLRGRFAGYRCDSSGRAVVMPMFHPRFLLHNPDMKKAAWHDLLAVKQRLAGTGGKR